MKRLWNEHPNLVSFALLTVGMWIILYFSARHVGFTPTQWLALAVATLVLAALCVWIIGWEADEEDETQAVSPTVSQGTRETDA